MNIQRLLLTMTVLATTAAASADGVFGTPIRVPEVNSSAFALAIDGNILYCGAGQTLYVLDVSSPTEPRVLSKLGGFASIRQIAVENGLLGISARGGGAWLVDVSDPSAAKILSHYDSVEQATGMEIAGNFMAIGERGTGVEFVDITDRAHPQHIRMIKTQEAQSCRYRDGILFSGDWHSGKVNLIDVSDLSKAEIFAAAEMQGFGDGFDLDGNLLYASTGHHRKRGAIENNTHPDNFGKGHGVEIWDISDPRQPRFLSRIDFPAFWRHGNDWWMSRESNGWLFCSDTHNGLYAIDARDPENPKIVDHFCDKNPKDDEAPSRCINSIAVGDGAVFAASLGGGLWVLPCDVAKFRPQDRGRELPPEVLSWREPYATPDDSHFRAWVPPTRGQVHSAAAYGAYIYAGCSYAGAFVIDAKKLQTVARIPCDYARDVVIRDDLLYIAQGDDGLGIYSLEDPANPREVRRIRDFGRGITHCEWVYVPTPRWAVCHARRNSGRWQFIDLSKEPAEYAGEAPGMDWVRPFSDNLVGGKWLGYARTHNFFTWYDLSGDKPVAFSTEDRSLTGPMPQRTNYIKSASCCTPISGDRMLVANSDHFILLNPGQDRNPDGSAWPKIKYSNTNETWPSGMCTWDGATRVLLAATAGRAIQMADFADPLNPRLAWREKTAGNPENAAIDDHGRFLVPCGYQGLLVEKRVVGPDELAQRPASIAPEPIPLGPLEWKLPKTARREGNRLFTSLAPGEEKTDGRASAKLDPAIFRGRARHCLRFTIRAKGIGIAKPKVNYHGLKFMLRLESPTGAKRWPGAPNRIGDWGEEEISFACDISESEVAAATLYLGLEQCAGNVEFDLDSLRVEDIGEIQPPVNQDFRVAYPRAVREAGAYRGVMLAIGLNKDWEDDFATLESWGANLARYQISKDWKKAGGWESNDDYDAYFNGALDILEHDVLPAAERHGVKIVVDMHATPGARNAAEENRIFFEKRYAEHYARVWKRVAERFKGDKRIYGYDLVNEPMQRGPAPYSYLYVQRAAAMAIRSVDPDATIIVAANGYGHPVGFKTLSPLRMDNVVYTAHCYAPMGFTHQGTHDKKRDNLNHYPDPEKGWDKECIRKALEPMLEFSRKHNARIFVGEFSAIAWAPGADAYIRDCCEILNEYGWDWCYHAFREWEGWSVEKTWKGLDPKTNRDIFEPTDDDPRKLALLKGLRP